MENIAAARPDMAVLDQNKLMLSPFGALSHALAEEILARTGQAGGVYPFVPMELLTEPERGPEEKKEEPAVNVEVKLTLELTKEARELRERTETVERILERIERIRERGEATQKPQGRERDTAPSGESRSFFQNINQHISFPMTLSVPENSGTAQPGGIARISEKFSNTLKTMREEGIYSEPGGETRRIADAGREGARIAGEQAAGSGAVSGGAATRYQVSTRDCERSGHMSKTTVTAPEKSLVECVSALSAFEGGSHRPSGATVPTRPGPEHPVADGYMRLSPVQPLYRAENYYRTTSSENSYPKGMT